MVKDKDLFFAPLLFLLIVNDGEDYLHEMGCTTSNDEKQEDEEVQEGGDGFTENQIDSIKSTWPILNKNRKKIGTEMFRNIFLLEPKIKTLFKGHQ